MNKSLILLFLFISTQVYAYIPTVESLFRNGANGEVANSTVVSILNIERIISLQQSELETIPKKNAVKLLINNENRDRQKFIQLDFRDGVVSDTTMNKIHFRKALSLKNLGILETNHVEAQVFYSLVSTLLANDSGLFMEMFRKFEPAVQSNEQLINKTQLNLINQYKYYLKKLAKQEDQEIEPEQTEQLENPLRPEDDEKRSRVAKIMREPFLHKDILIKRVRQRNKFYWDMNGQSVYARFDGENHQLKKLVVSTEQGKIEVDCYNYILFNGKLEFPETIYFKDLSGQMYEIKLVKLYKLSEQPGRFSKILKNYERTLNKNDQKNSEIIKPPFLI